MSQINTNPRIYRYIFSFEAYNKLLAFKNCWQDFDRWSGIVEAQNQALNQRWDKLETARRHTRKIAYALMAVALTSLAVAIT